MRTRTVAAAVALGTTMLALTGLAACGRAASGSQIATAGGKSSASAHPSASVDPQEQARQFAQCMRDHGVDMPDPETVDGAGGDGGGVRITVSGAPGAGMDAAMEACKDKLPDGGTPPSMDPQQQEQLRAFAQCMRDHGVDMPDPDPNSGALRITQSGAAPQFGPDDPTFKAAQEACQDKLPGSNGGVTTQNGGGGTGPGFSIGGGQ
jgi:hypothetical protein